MVRRKRLVVTLVALVLGSVGACKPSNTGGLDLHGKPNVGMKQPPPAASVSSSAEAAKPDENEAHRLAWQAIGCFVGGPWSEALGASGEERVLADTKRCREIANGPLGAKPEDEKALDAVRAADPEVVTRLLPALEKKFGDKRDEKLLALVRAAADAGREAQAVRRVAEAMRKSKTKQPSEADAATLAAKVALTALSKVGTDEARLVQLVLGADRVESARGLAPAGKLSTASPGFEVVFGVAPSSVPKDAEQSDWVTYLTGVAKAAGHAPQAVPEASQNELEQAAFTGVAQGFADRFEALAAKLAPSVAKGAANGYAAQLRNQLADAEAKVKAKNAAKKSSTAASASASAMKNEKNPTKPEPKTKAATSP